MYEDLLSLLPETECSRRQFVVTALSAGFALAVQPVTAQTITTDATGLTAGEVKIPVADGEIPAYRAIPASGGPFPVALVVQEIFGVHETNGGRRRRNWGPTHRPALIARCRDWDPTTATRPSGCRTKI